MKISKNEMIHIGDSWALRGDKYCLTLYKRYVSKHGKEYFKEDGHYPDFHTAYRAMVNKEIMPLNNIKSIIIAVDNLLEFANQRLSDRF